MEKLSSDQHIVRVHRRQFVIGPREFLAHSDWRTFELQPGLILSADPDLRVGMTTDLDGACWFLLGLVVDTRPEFATPLEEIARRHTKDVLSLYEGWTGRWALVGGGCLHPDGAAMLGCYYGKNTIGESWASSSPILIGQALGLAGGPVVDAASEANGGKISWRPLPDATVTGAVRGISWYPPPHSSIPGVFRLLPSQILNLQLGSCQPRLLAGHFNGNYTDSELFGALHLSFSTAIQRFAALNAPNDLTLLLSGGRDSRLLLSIAAAADISVKTFTRIHRRASLADRVLPPKLARIAGYSHTKHYQRNESPGSIFWGCSQYLRGCFRRSRSIAIAYGHELPPLS